MPSRPFLLPLSSMARYCFDAYNNVRKTAVTEYAYDRYVREQDWTLYDYYCDGTAILGVKSEL